MKRSITALTLVLFFVSLFAFGIAFKARKGDSSVSLVPGAEAKDKDDDDEDGGSCPRNCSLRTLNGCYGTITSGNINEFGPFAAVIRTIYDGAGHLTQFDTVSINGNITAIRREASGTYTVDPECTGTATVTFPDGFSINSDFIIVDHGREIQSIVTNGGFTVTALSKKQ